MKRFWEYLTVFALLAACAALLTVPDHAVSNTSEPIMP